jgi:hypothetical protein
MPLSRRVDRIKYCMKTAKEATDILYVQLAGKYMPRVYSTVHRTFTPAYPHANNEFKPDALFNSIPINYIDDSTKDINP